MFQLNSDYNLITLKYFGKSVYVCIFYDKHVYFFHDVCVDFSESH